MESSESNTPFPWQHVWSGQNKMAVTGWSLTEMKMNGTCWKQGQLTSIYKTKVPSFECNQLITHPSISDQITDAHRDPDHMSQMLTQILITDLFIRHPQDSTTRPRKTSNSLSDRVWCHPLWYCRLTSTCHHGGHRPGARSQHVLSCCHSVTLCDSHFISLTMWFMTSSRDSLSGFRSSWLSCTFTPFSHSHWRLFILQSLNGGMYSSYGLKQWTVSSKI